MAKSRRTGRRVLIFHIDDPAQMTPEERLRELAAIFARAVLRLNKRSPRFECEGRVYRSLSAIAKEVTGTHWNGFGFFGLLDKGAKK
jgi:hypothetical protein